MPGGGEGRFYAIEQVKSRYVTGEESTRTKSPQVNSIVRIKSICSAVLLYPLSARNVLISAADELSSGRNTLLTLSKPDFWV